MKKTLVTGADGFIGSHLTETLVRAGHDVRAFASAIGKSVINVDRDLGSVGWRRERSVDSQKYAAYRNKYIKMEGSPEMPHWDIVIDHIDRAAVQRGDSIRGASVPS